ncbi:PilZ domain-containing protein [Labrenzia sp. PHM005]|uniref:PilZ domain-containing protein n=1 Tax=Stappiaceae TaxID=2821832 RepID=UPI00113FDC3D|nr:PilZ domain-containing protein [Labrenzia sp. PHM005]QDG76741.1 PilZ domain-containing protein [Labrenzia sp. PHM005]
MSALAHLQDQPEAEEEVLVVDLENLSVVNAVISNVSEWGCRLTSPEIQELGKNIGIRPKDSDKLVKCQITSRKSDDAAVIFSKNSEKFADKRREKRNTVSIPVKISDFDGITEIDGTIVDAGKNGCRVMAKSLPALPEEVLLTMQKFGKPIVAEFAWRNDSAGGLRMLWDRDVGGDEEDEDAEAEPASQQASA